MRASAEWLREVDWLVLGSIHLTPFGDDFCRSVLVSADDAAEFPHHEPPGEPVE